eukprot:scaffold18997_cov101-Isochrysis_galbana.AAC.1
MRRGGGSRVVKDGDDSRSYGRAGARNYSHGRPCGVLDFLLVAAHRARHPQLLDLPPRLGSVHRLVHHPGRRRDAAHAERAVEVRESEPVAAETVCGWAGIVMWRGWCA